MTRGKELVRIDLAWSPSAYRTHLLKLKGDGNVPDELKRGDTMSGRTHFPVILVSGSLKGVGKKA